MKIINPKLKWKPVLKTDKDPFESFEYGDRGFRKYLHNEPAIYRLRLESPAGTIKQVYIGETATLRERVQRHTYGQKSDPYCVRNLFQKRGKIYLDTLEIEGFKINGIAFSQENLSCQYIRLVFENIMLCLAEKKHIEILNR